MFAWVICLLAAKRECRLMFEVVFLWVSGLMWDDLISILRFMLL